MNIHIRHFAVVLAATTLGGCIVLPPLAFYGPPPGLRGEMPPMTMSMHARGGVAPPWNLCDGLPEGARPALPGPRADALAGRCERNAEGVLEFRPAGPR